MARPAKRSPASKARPKAAKPAKPARPAAVKKAAKAAKAAKPVKKKVAGKTVRAKPAAPKGKPVKRPIGKPPAKPAGKPAPKTAAKPAGRASAAKAPPAKPAPPAAKPPAQPKAAAPKPAPEPPKKPRKPELTPKEIATIRASLVEQRNVFMREFSDLEDAAFNVSQSEISGEVSFDEEYADAGSFTFEREKEMSIGNNIRDLLDKVNHAINAIDRGTYGICENCGNPIAKARLQALPYSTLCLNCKQIDERTR
ncbi:MAG TPA: TraR/DksA C4-type zinc finger protein [Actinomycetota bacterium]|nr:TraR/DksA C4-type zinc finger protein [Actinomycetota bacterium]